MIVAVPSATEVTRPVDDTVATDAADVAHVTVAPLIDAPFWSLTVAEIGNVWPSEMSLTLVAERVIDVATGVGVGVVGESPPPQLAKSSENELHATIFFMPSFCPAPLRPATQDAQNSAHRFWISGGGVRGVYPTGGRACRQKGPARATKYFSGNGVSVASICAARHKHCPPVAAEGGEVRRH